MKANSQEMGKCDGLSIMLPKHSHCLLSGKFLLAFS